MIKTVPNVTFKIRERDDSIGGDNPFKWVEKNVKDLFKNKNVILFLYLELLHQLAQPINYPILTNYMMNFQN